MILGLLLVWVALDVRAVIAPIQALAGITIGEAGADVRRVLGTPIKSTFDAGLYESEYVINGGRTRVAVELSNDHVVGILALTESSADGGSRIVDSMGIGLGDPISHVRELRGEPDRVTSHDLRYQIPTGGFWQYDYTNTYSDSKPGARVDVIGVTTVMYGVSLSAISRPSGSEWTSSTLAGVSLGEARDTVQKRLGPPTTPESQTGWRKTVYQVDDGDTVYVDYDGNGRVEAVQVFLFGGGKVLAAVDPYGVGLNDSLATLFRLRGAPLEQQQMGAGRHLVRYAAGSDAVWEYFLSGGTINWITLAKKTFRD